MTNAQVKTILGALVAIGLVIAVSYGLISQQTADQIKTQTDQTLSNGQTNPAPNATTQQPAPQNSNNQGVTAPGMAPQTTTPAPKQ